MTKEHDELPPGWIKAKITEVAKYHRGVSYEKPQAIGAAAPGYVAILRANNLGAGFDFEDLVFVPDTLIDGDQFVRANDIVFAMSSGSKKHVGKSVLAIKNLECAFGAFCGLLRPKSDIVPAFLAMQFEGPSFRRYIEETALGTNINNLKSSALLSYEIAVAPLNEQRRIVAKIEELFSELDKGVESLTTAREQLKVYRQSVLKYAFEGKFTEDWRRNDLIQLRSAEQIKTFLEGARRNALETSWRAKNRPPIPFDNSDLPVCPTDWALVSMDSLCHHITSGSRDWSQFYDRGTSIFVMAQNIRPGRYDRSVVQHVDPPIDNAETERTRVCANDILVTIVGANTGDVCRFPLQSNVYYVCQSVALLRLSCPEYAKFVELYFQSRSGGQKQYVRYIYGAGRPHLSFEQLKQTVVPIPDPREAEKIVSVVNAIFSELAEMESMIDAELKRAASLRHAVLRAAFSGQLVPQETNDEPACVLMERIHAEQQDGGAKKRHNTKNGKKEAV